MSNAKMTKTGRELAEALTEVLGDVTGATPLKGRKARAGTKPIRAVRQAHAIARGKAKPDSDRVREPKAVRRALAG